MGMGKNLYGVDEGATVTIEGLGGKSVGQTFDKPLFNQIPLSKDYLFTREHLGSQAVMFHDSCLEINQRYIRMVNRDICSRQFGK